MFVSIAKNVFVNTLVRSGQVKIVCARARVCVCVYVYVFLGAFDKRSGKQVDELSAGMFVSTWAFAVPNSEVPRGLRYSWAHSNENS